MAAMSVWEFVLQERKKSTLTACLLVAILYGGFGLVDLVLFPSVAGHLFLIRVVVMVQCLTIAAMILVRPKWYAQYSQVLFISIVVVAGAGILSMNQLIAGLPNDYAYFPGLLLVLAGAFVFFPIRFPKAVATVGVLIVAYNASLWWLDSDISVSMVVANNFFLLGCAIICGRVGYDMERLIRLQYDNHALFERQQQEREDERTASAELLQNSLKTSLEERNTILENAVVAIAFLNPEKQVVWANRALHDLLQLPREIGPQGISLKPYYLSEADYTEVACIVDAAVNAGLPFQDERKMRRNDGSEHWAILSGRAVNRQDRARGTVWTLMDISDRRLAEEETHAALARQRELNDLKAQFVSMASHEFRTPLTTILSSTELLQAYYDRLTPQERETTLHGVDMAVCRMTKMLDDILVIGKGDSIANDLRPGLIALRPWCEQLIREVCAAQGKTGEPRCRVRLEVNPAPGECLLDEALLRHILGNLLSNAIKYSSSSAEAVLRISREGAFLCIEVEDSGIGIHEADMKRLFEAFYRAGNVGNIQGTGLGLAIVKRAVDRHGGTISVRSEVGRGTCFTVHIPQPLPADTR